MTTPLDRKYSDCQKSGDRNQQYICNLVDLE